MQARPHSPPRSRFCIIPACPHYPPLARPLSRTCCVALVCEQPCASPDYGGVELVVTHVQTQWSGKLPADYPVAWRADTGQQYANFNFRSSGIKRSPNIYEHPNMPSFNATLDVSGGFYEDGPWGPVKLTKSIALSTSLLAWTLIDAEGTMREDENVMVRPHLCVCACVSVGLLRHPRCP